MKSACQFAFLILLVSFTLASGTERLQKDLRGRWRFETGNDDSFSSAEFDDSKWDKIRVPGIWEKRGYEDYDGYAWYRTDFTVYPDLKNKILILDLGTIDDVDRVYLNGRLIGGKGEISPKYLTAYNVRRRYPIPEGTLRFDRTNCLAVQVYDDGGEGGIVSGRIGIYSVDSDEAVLDLTGGWKFKLGDDRLWAHPELDDKTWEKIVVPADWESQGHPDDDGYAWYRLSVTLPRQLSGKALLFTMGAVDDADEVYLNGERIGRTGYFPAEKYGKANEKFYNRRRVYSIPLERVRWGEENIFAVRVYDVWGKGGICQGPVQIITKKEFSRHRQTENWSNWSRNDEGDSFWDKVGSFFDDLF
jgi:sialate O-acetylesterase